MRVECWCSRVVSFCSISVGVVVVGGNIGAINQTGNEARNVAAKRQDVTACCQPWLLLLLLLVQIARPALD